MSIADGKIFHRAVIFHVTRSRAPFGKRVFEARMQLQAKLGRNVTLTEFAERVSKEMGKEPVSPSTVKRWLEGTIPDVATIAAIAAACDVSPGWLAFGEGGVSERDSVAPARKQRHSPQPEGNHR